MVGKKTCPPYPANQSKTPTTLTTTWIYNSGVNGIGRLTRMSDESGNTTFSYDQHGRLLSKRQMTLSPQVSQQTNTVTYSYNTAGQMISQITPDNNIIIYGYDVQGRISSLGLNGKILLNNLQYQPFGAPKSWTWGNGSNYSRSFDNDGRLNRYPIANDDRSISYDAAGNSLSDGARTITWNDRGRLKSTAFGTYVNSYLYNALGQRVIKMGSFLTNAPYRFVYDNAGHIIGEYDSNNALRQETIWLGDIPVAIIQPDAIGVKQVYYVQADHLNTPRILLNSNNVPVWRGDRADPFGSNNLPDQDPDGDGKQIEMNLRFPGQYYDKETGLHYNYFRDYHPDTGRYIASDPIGLQGGLNTYGYVGGNPVGAVDPQGLTAEGAAVGGTIGAGIGGAVGGVLGGAGGTLALPGGGTIAGTAMGAAQGIIDGAIVGATVGDAISNLCDPDKPKKCQLQVQGRKAQ